MFIWRRDNQTHEDAIPAVHATEPLQAPAGTARVTKVKSNAHKARSYQLQDQTVKMRAPLGMHASVKWQYWVGDGVDGKRDGWYDYTEECSDVVEAMYQRSSSGSGEVVQFAIKASNLKWSYFVDLATMTQVNTAHANRTVRHIRRWTPALGNDATPPGYSVARGVSSTAGAKPVEVTVVIGPNASVSRCSGTTKTAPVAAHKPGRSTSSFQDGSIVKPLVVDTMCPLPDAVLVEGYSVATRSLKRSTFFTLQLLRGPGMASHSFYVWRRAGSLGSIGTGELTGGFSRSQARDVFQQKFQERFDVRWDPPGDFSREDVVNDFDAFVAA